MTETSNDGVLPVHPVSPGALIKAAREKAGIHLAILSVNLKVSVKQLEALEADQYEKLIEPVFARALAAKVCRMIKLDANQVLALMPAAANGLKPLNLIDTDRHASFDGQRTDRQRTQIWSGFKFWILLALLVVLMFAFGNDLTTNIEFFNAKPTATEVVPVMPPVQEPVAPEAAQNELPKAMVFDGASTTGNAPAIVTSQPVSTEVKK